MQKKFIVILLILFTVIVIINLKEEDIPVNELWDSYSKFSKKRYDPEAVKILNKILDQNPNNAIAHNNLASYELEKENWDKALIHLQQASNNAQQYRIDEVVNILAINNK